MKIGLITYHAAYNYGSILQAYATQCAIEKMGYSVEIINYRMIEQKRVYSLYRMKYGIKTLIKDLIQIPIHFQRKERCAKFEQFFTDYLNLTMEYRTPEEVRGSWNDYDVIISGSDQIWNKHSLELENNTWEYMEPYLLAGYKGKKVSYASSIANMSDEELTKIAHNMKMFSNISLREISSVKRVKNDFYIEAQNVVDPTFLLTNMQWIDLLGLEKSHKNSYILYYTLEGFVTFWNNIKLIKKIAKMENRKVLIVSPFVYLPICDDLVELCPMLGPIEFLNTIYNAEKIITNSYHGTILAVNFEKDVYSVCKNIGAEFRKTDILTQLGLEERIVSDLDVIINKEFEQIDYVQIREKLDRFREKSWNYLKDALCYKEK